MPGLQPPPLGIQIYKGEPLTSFDPNHSRGKKKYQYHMGFFGRYVLLALPPLLPDAVLCVYLFVSFFLFVFLLYVYFFLFVWLPTAPLPGIGPKVINGGYTTHG